MEETSRQASPDLAPYHELQTYFTSICGRFCRPHAEIFPISIGIIPDQNGTYAHDTSIPDRLSYKLPAGKEGGKRHMKNLFISRNLSIWLSGAALLSFLGRTFIDYGYVFPEFGIDMPELFPITLGMLAFYGGWLWALIASAGGSRAGFITVLLYNLLLLLFGISTFTTLCPSPCETAWPLGETLMWSNIVIGVAASLATIGALRGSVGSRIPFVGREPVV
jgi:hypothetical protein